MGSSGSRWSGWGVIDILAATLDRDTDLAVERLIAHYTKTGAFLADTLA